MPFSAHRPSHAGLPFLAGTMLGSFIRSRLPADHLLDDSRDVVKMASGMIATLLRWSSGLW